MLPDTETRPKSQTGHRRTELIVASSAIFISVCSLALAIHQSHTMERLVEANSRPFLQFDPATANCAQMAGWSVSFRLLFQSGDRCARISGFQSRSKATSWVTGPMCCNGLSKRLLRSTF